jgi:flavin reductase (DIM6/NTAB) family NADH-FMN oxidoreductase RutF
MLIDPAQLSPADVYRLLIATVVPRPIAWVSSVAADGVRNLAPFSFFTVVSQQPPMILLALEPRWDGEDKDTLVNIRAMGEFVVNVVSAHLAAAMNESSQEHPREVDEFVVGGVTPAPSTIVQAPRVDEACVSMECTLESLLKPGSDTLIIGRILAYHVRDELVGERGRIDVDALRPLGRLAGTYAAIDRTYRSPVDAALQLAPAASPCVPSNDRGVD